MHTHNKPAKAVWPCWSFVFILYPSLPIAVNIMYLHYVLIAGSTWLSRNNLLTRRKFQFRMRIFLNQAISSRVQDSRPPSPITILYLGDKLSKLNGSSWIWGFTFQELGEDVWMWHNYGGTSNPVKSAQTQGVRTPISVSGKFASVENKFKNIIPCYWLYLKSTIICCPQN